MRYSLTCKISVLVLAGIFGVNTFLRANDAAGHLYRIMPVGDSITEGGATFCSYRFPLWEKLFTAGYLIEFVGSRTNESRIGSLCHEGYSGKNTEFLAETLKKTFREHPADIVLIHSGHNHSTSEMPVPGIVKATESMIRTVREVNPKVIVLLAQVIPSGKSPKYDYIPELNRELGGLATRLNTSQQPVIIVNQAEGFDWRTDTIEDHVHPNADGAEKIAGRWFAALTNVLVPPAQSFHPKLIDYKNISNTRLFLHIFFPCTPSNDVPHPAIVFFFGGGWQYGTPIQFYPECEHFAEEGWVAVSADYRIASVNHTTPFESVADGKSAIRWLRENAAGLDIDPHRIVAAGASAGGQVAAAAGMVPGLDEPGENLKVSSQPDALILWSPVVDNGPGGYGYEAVKERFAQISPLHNIDSGTPPTLFFLGTQDGLVPVRTAEEFKKRVEAAGGRCELKLFEGAGHPIYEYRRGDSPYRRETLADADAFLTANGFLVSSRASPGITGSAKTP